MELIEKVPEMKAWSAGHRVRGHRLGLVPTMGYLHDGHLSLVSYARGKCDRLVASIFVNPKQFGPREDLAQYPRALERDLALLEQIGVDAVFHPQPGEIYPPGFQTRVEVLEITKGLCGAFRPDLFPGVTTVVLKLFNIVQPDLAVFGEKDYQQLLTIKRMVKDLNMDLTVEGQPTVREPDGLAMSSRNTYLSAEERLSASAIPAALKMAQELAEQGVTGAAEILGAVRRHIEARPGCRVQYAELVDPESLAPKAEVDGDGRALLALAVMVGRTRLIDNAILGEKPA
ncbi:MAG: pantoate--beta-alanine ligase [Pseudomonadota bacterium]